MQMELQNSIHLKVKYVAKNLDNNIASQGKRIEEALENLKEAIELYNE